MRVNECINNDCINNLGKMKINILLKKLITISTLSAFLFNGFVYSMDVPGGYSNQTATLSPELMMGNTGDDSVLSAKLIYELIEKRVKENTHVFQIDDIKEWALSDPDEEILSTVNFHLYGREVHLVVGDEYLVRYFDITERDLDFLFSDDE